MNMTTDKLLARSTLKPVRVENYSNLIILYRAIYKRILVPATYMDEIISRNYTCSYFPS